MSVQTNRDLWQSWTRLWNGNMAIADEIIALDFVAHFAPMSGSPSEVRGPQGMQQWVGGAVGAFKDYSFTTEVGPIVDEDKVAGRWIFRGIYQGGMPGASADAIGKEIRYAGIDLFRVNEAGKIVEYWLCADILQLLQQVGVIPA